MEIVRGKQSTPIRAVAYGPEGIGKSTFAAAWPKPLFVDAEGGTARLAVDRIHPLSWAAVTGAVDELARDPHGYQTLVFDTADWLEKLLIDSVCADANMKSIEAFGYGKGYTHLAEAWKRFLDRLSLMQQQTGMHVLFLAHASMRKFEQPDEAGAYDRWEMKLSKQSGPLLKEWSDLLLFLNYRTLVVEVDGRKKAQGGQRVMFSSHHPCWDAKNRFGLPDELPMEFAAIAAIFTASASPPPPAPVQPAPAAPVAQPEIGEKGPLLQQLAQLMTASGVTKDDLGAELARKGVCPADMNPRQMNEATLRRVIAGWTAITHNINRVKQQAA